MQYRPDIDGLRSLAIVPVVLYHSGLPGLSGGFLGVDVFFVISGYLITSILISDVEAGRYSLLDFYERRARRILPALFAVIVACLVAGWFVLLPPELEELGESIFATALFMSNIYFLITLDYFATAADFKPLLHTWSLAVEEQFYLFFPPLLAFVAGRFGRRVMIWTLVALSALSLLAAIWAVSEQPVWAFYLIVFRAWELGLGALLALIPLRPLTNGVLRNFAAVTGLGLVLGPMVLYTSATPFPGLAAVPPVLGSALLIWVGGIGGSALSRVLSLRLLVGIGLISYSLYLWHWPVMSFTRIVSGQAHLTPGLSLATITVSLVLATLSYFLIERPFRKRAPQGFGRGAIFRLTATVTVVSILSGLALHLANGSPSRLPAEAQALANARFDRNPDRPRCFNKQPADGLCPFGAKSETGKVDFFFWGDSHASALAPGLDIAARAAGQSGLYAGFVACPPLPGAVRMPPTNRCAENRAAILDFLQSRNDMRTVILAARWTLSVEGTPYGQEAGDPVRLRWQGDDQNADNNPALVDLALRTLLDDLTKRGRAVVLLGPVPEIGFDAPTRLARAEWLDFDVPTELGKDAFNTRAAPTEALLQGIAGDFPAVRYLSLSAALCSEDACPIQDPNGRPLYFDDDHPSFTAATTLYPDILGRIWRDSASGL